MVLLTLSSLTQQLEFYPNMIHFKTWLLKNALHLKVETLVVAGTGPEGGITYKARVTEGPYKESPPLPTLTHAQRSVLAQF